MVKFSRERLILAWTFLFGLLTHGYCYFNLSYSHDSVMVRQGDVLMQITVGRFLHLPYVRFRGDLYNPALVGALSLLFLGLAVCLMVRLLDIKNKVLTVLVTGILTANVTVTLTNASYIQDVDMYMLSLLLATAGVYVCARFRYGCFLAPVFFCLSLGFYQAYFQAAVFLAMICVVKRILDQAETREILKTGLRLVGSLLLGLILYSVVLQIVLKITHLTLLSTYGMGGAAKYDSLAEMLLYLFRTYKFVLSYFLRPIAHLGGITAVLNVGILTLSLALLGLFVRQKHIYGWNLFFLAAVLCLMPFGINVVYFISHGEEHHLMIYAFFLAYLFAVFLADRFLEENPLPRLRRIVEFALPCALAFLLFDNVVYASQVYLKKDLEYQTTVFTMTRIVDRLEQLEGYVPGETPVAIVGQLEDSAVSLVRPGLGDLSGATGLWKNFSVTYYETYATFLQRILGYPVNILPQQESAGWAERASGLPAFPAPGSCAMLDGTAVLKLS